MAYTVKQLAAMSGVSVRTLHFYDETGLLEPAYCGANGLRTHRQPLLRPATHAPRSGRVDLHHRR